MPKVAKAQPGTTIVVGEDTFIFDDDGTRQVSAKEAEVLQRYLDNGGPAKVTIEDRAEPKTKRKGASDG